METIDSSAAAAASLVATRENHDGYDGERARGVDGADRPDRPGVGPLLTKARKVGKRKKMASERTASDGAILGHNHRTHAYADAVHVLIEAKNASGFLPPRRSSLAPPNTSTKRQRTTTTLHPSIPVPDALIASLSSTALGQFTSYLLTVVLPETLRHRAHRPLCSPSPLRQYHITLI